MLYVSGSADSLELTRKVARRTVRSFGLQKQRFAEKLADRNSHSTRTLGRSVLEQVIGLAPDANTYMLADSPGLAHYGRKRVEGDRPCPFLDMRNGHEGRFALVSLRQLGEVTDATIRLYEDHTKSMQDILVLTDYHIQPDGVISHRRTPLKLKFRSPEQPEDSERILCRGATIRRLSEFVAAASVIANASQIARSIEHFQERVDQYLPHIADSDGVAKPGA